MRVLLALLVISLAGFGLAVKTHQNFAEVDNARFITRLELPTALTTNGRISSTRVPVTTIARVKDILPRPENHIVEARLWKSRLTVGGQEVFNKEYAVTWTGPPYGSGPESEPDFLMVGDSPDPIFASTHFAHGSSVVVELKNTYRYLYLNQTEGSPVEVTATVTTEAYNAAALWRTSVYENGTPLQAPHLGYLSDAHNALDAFLFFSNYTLPLSELADFDEIESALSVSTAMFAVTHGSGSGLSDSYVDPMSWLTLRNAQGDRYSEAAIIAPLTAIVAISCDTQHEIDISFDFHPWGPTQGEYFPIVNSHLYGFDRSILMTSAVSSHTQVYLLNLEYGATVQRAVTEANSQYPQVPSPSDPDQSVVLAQLEGDPASTLRHVYVPWFARQLLPRYFTNWFWYID